jgi:hypothetical protein
VEWLVPPVDDALDECESERSVSIRTGVRIAIGVFILAAFLGCFSSVASAATAYSKPVGRIEFLPDGDGGEAEK